MKKLIYLFATILLITSIIKVPHAHACSPVPGYQYPTMQDVLNDDGKIFIVKTLASGEAVAAVVQNYPTIMTAAALPARYVVLEGNPTSCSTAFNFNANDYYLIVTPENKPFVITHHDLDDQFSIKYNSLSEAQSAYDALVSGQNPNPPLPNPTGYTPVGYTLKYGMRGDDVRALQQALANFHYDFQVGPLSLPPAIPPITVDGIYGNQTVTAVKFFQSYTGLKPVDGIAGERTQTVLSTYGMSVPMAQ